MSILLEFSIFPTTQGESLTAYVSPVIEMIRDTGVDYRLTPMGTIIETETLAEALAMVERAHALLEARGCDRIYASVKIDSRRGGLGRMQAKIASVERHVGEVSS